jgi:hypothetical protein
MPQRDRQQTVLELLRNFRSLDSLKELFWSELNYERVNQPLPRRNWTETAAKALAEDPLLFAGGGANNEFHVIYARLTSNQLLLGHERPVVSRLLRDHPYALFVFSNAIQNRWHFLNIKYDEKSDKRRLFRRITVGPEERLRTASERLAMLDLEAIQPDLFGLPPLAIQQRCDEAFDVEAVTKQFFKIFAELYHTVAEDITRVRGLEKEAGRLAQLLLDRLLFLYFIQKKGWLNNEPDYLYTRFRECWKNDPSGHSYYSDVLYPLFLCLSDTKAEDESVGAVPFLNGGLFEESVRQSQAERLEQSRLRIRNTTFKAIFDNLLERFNFTVTEDTPLDVEVAIDPEMLGKIFESLILQLEKDPDKDLRKLTGSYYTPRPIVHFMCQEALKEYLVTQLVGNDTVKVDAAREKIGTLLSLPLADQLDEEQIETLKVLFTPTEAKALRQAILDCRICDPAVGSGAFPVGMLHEMVATVARLDLHLHGPEALKRRNYDYDLKKQIIESCLYGVDIQEQAVRLCELRLWLSLVVDYQIDLGKPFARAIREVPSLPNLSYHIVRGDSLLERLFGHVVQLDQMARDARTKQLIKSIQADKMSYFREGNTTEKRRLELKILAKQADLTERLIEAKLASLQMYQPHLLGDDHIKAKERAVREQNQKLFTEMATLKTQVTKAKGELERISRLKGPSNRGDLDTLRRTYFQTGDAPTFVWQVDFAEVFREKDGFDVMIANPPYVRADKGEAHLAMRGDILRSGFYETLWEKWDLYVPFIERAYKMLRLNGVLQFITSDAYCHAKYAQRSQEWFLRNALVRRLDFVSDLQIFEAGIRNVIFCYQRADGRNNAPLRIRHEEEFGSIIPLPSVPQNEATHRLFQPDSHKQARTTTIETVPLEKICYVSVGAVVHADEKEHLGEFRLEDLVQDYPDKKHPKIFAEGKDLARWIVKRVRYIEWGTHRAPAHFRRTTFPEMYGVKEKLISVDMAAGTAKLRVAYDDAQVFHNHSAWSFVPWYLLKGVRNRSIAKSAKYRDEAEGQLAEYREDLEDLSRQFNLKFILAVMNSSWARDYLRSRRRSNIHLYPDDWKPLPIPVASQNVQEVIANKVDEILKALKKGQNISPLEDEVDKMVSALYGVGTQQGRELVVVSNASVI